MCHGNNGASDALREWAHQGWQCLDIVPIAQERRDSSPFVFVQCECYIIIFLLVLHSINSQKGMERMNPLQLSFLSPVINRPHWIIIKDIKPLLHHSINRTSKAFSRDKNTHKLVLKAWPPTDKIIKERSAWIKEDFGQIDSMSNFSVRRK